MKKELEAIIRKELEQLTDTHYEPKRTEDIDNAMKVIKQALTPPTETEVCEALSKYYDKVVYYEGDMFILQHNKTKRSSKDIILTRLFTSGLKINWELPPYLITMIGRFYEEESEVKK